MRVLLVAAVVSLVGVQGVAAQNSVYGVLGAGFPGRPLGVGARSLGGAVGVFDATSSVNPAAISPLRNIVVTASTGTIVRNYVALDTTVDGLRETRFPHAMLGGWIRGTPVTFGVSLSTYADRTYNIVTNDSVEIRGRRLAVVDQISSDGSVGDIRGALSWRFSNWLAVGGAVHLLSGSARLAQQRSFSDSTYRPLNESETLGFAGLGWSAGVLATPLSSVRIAAALRSDGSLKAKRDSVRLSETELPLSFTAGIYLVPVPALRVAGTVSRHTWSDAAPDLASQGTRAFDTWEVGTGIELPVAVAGTIPLRLGFRYAQLPFSPTDEQPRELNFSAGTAFRFAAGRAVIDASVERILRDGGGAVERAWYFAFSMTVRP